MKGLDRLCVTLARLKVTHVFGLPGTQNAELFHAFPRHSIRPVLATHELSASFMANGYARSSGEVGVLATIPGPGFTYALPGLAEARLDSVPLLHLVGPTGRRSAMHFQHQAIDEAGVARPLAKDVVDIATDGDIEPGLQYAHDLAQSGEPGPVVVLLRGQAFDVGGADAPSRPWPEGLPRAVARPEAWRELVALVRAAERPVVYVGSGAASAASRVSDLVSRLRAPVFTTLSARGILPEDHPSALRFDAERGGIGALNSLLERADLILALGCRMGHNGTAGFGLQLPEDRLVHVNTDPLALGVNYPARLLIQASVGEAVTALLTDAEPWSSRWTMEELDFRRADIGTVRPPPLPEPRIRGVPGGGVEALFQGFRAALPRDAIVVTDSGLHQALARRHFDVLAPGGLITPADFQSMGFGLPAALGARLGAPGRTVVALVGDGGFIMSAMDLLCAKRERVHLVVIVFNDGHLNLIRLQQLRDFGHTSGVDLLNPDLETLSAALSVGYSLLEGDPAQALTDGLAREGPSVLEVRLGDSLGIVSSRARATARAAIRQALGHRLVDRLKRLVRPPTTTRNCVRDTVPALSSEVDGGRAYHGTVPGHGA